MLTGATGIGSLLARGIGSCELPNMDAGSKPTWSAGAAHGLSHWALQPLKWVLINGQHVYAITFIQIKRLLSDHSTIRMKCNPADLSADMSTVLLFDRSCTKEWEDSPSPRKDEKLMHAEISHCVRSLENSTETTLTWAQDGLCDVKFW